jgi:hypothetical protein
MPGRRENRGFCGGQQGRVFRRLWYGFASWEAHPVFGAYFRLVHANEHRNIAVFSRR